ncbi:phosphoribosylpyrophosphate synthetase [Flavobacterium zepuense]|uniref:phosphoribosylpyrophosphate synthetase n=1 Tax=Flavobacterium zepuense TaxID=2593302 RepID=UPI001F384018|nr:phosphoribosylpyrophosphate synthetase [Flavobacterium zepuense]
MQNLQPSFDTVTETLTWLRNEGFTRDFNLAYEYLEFNRGANAMAPEDFHIEWVFRFEGDTDPGDEEIIYGITSTKFNVKGAAKRLRHVCRSGFRANDQEVISALE